MPGSDFIFCLVLFLVTELQTPMHIIKQTKIAMQARNERSSFDDDYTVVIVEPLLTYFGHV